MQRWNAKVAQTDSLPYRGLVIRCTFTDSNSAEYQSAIQLVASLRYRNSTCRRDAGIPKAGSRHQRQMSFNAPRKSGN